MSEGLKALKDGICVGIDPRIAEIQLIYRQERLPWVVGYSGGKDSTAALQLVWMALSAMPFHERQYPVHVLSTDTLVENPVVSAWVRQSHDAIKLSAQKQGLPIQAHTAEPTIEDSFWVNLIGRGYPSPRPKFRWCTERLKIRPSNKIITDIVKQYGGAILVLGTRRAESQARARVMQRLDAQRYRERLTPNAALPGCLVYTPLEDWSNDDVWMFLTQVDNPWGWSNHDLLGLYQGATEGGECPLVVDTSTPSCGDSRFGCWVCTLVDKDKSMAAMIANDADKAWMGPLIAFRNRFLDPRDDEGFRADSQHRDFRRMGGQLTLECVPRAHEEAQNAPLDGSARQAALRRAEYFNRNGRVHKLDENGVCWYLVHGPYIQSYRATLLRELLRAQQAVAASKPEIELITLAELEEIRRIWVCEKGEIEDLVPRIYNEVLGRPYPFPPLDEHLPFTQEDLDDLATCCRLTTDTVDAARLRYEAARDLLALEFRFKGLQRRHGLFQEIDRIIDRCAYRDEADALNIALAARQAAFYGRKQVEKVEAIFDAALTDTAADIPADAEIIEAIEDANATSHDH